MRVFLKGKVYMKPSVNKTAYIAVMLLFLVPSMFVSIAHGTEQANISGKTLPTLIDFGRGTCTICKMMKPMLDGLKKEYAGILYVEIIDIRYNPEALKKYKVPGVPFQLVFDASGRELTRHYGYADKEAILKMLKSVGIDVEKEKAQGHKKN